MSSLVYRFGWHLRHLQETGGGADPKIGINGGHSGAGQHGIQPPSPLDTAMAKLQKILRLAVTCQGKLIYNLDFG